MDWTLGRLRSVGVRDRIMAESHKIRARCPWIGLNRSAYKRKLPRNQFSLTHSLVSWQLRQSLSLSPNQKQKDLNHETQINS